MTPLQRRGRIYLITFISLSALSDIVIKGMLLTAGRLRWSQAVGTIITLTTLWFLWRGSRFAFGLMIFGMSVATIFILVASYQLPALFDGVCIIVIAALFFTLISPATRSFIALQRQNSD